MVNVISASIRYTVRGDWRELYEFDAVEGFLYFSPLHANVTSQRQWCLVELSSGPAGPCYLTCAQEGVRVRSTSVRDGSPWRQSCCFLHPAECGSPASPLNASSRQSQLCSAIQSLFETLSPCVSAISGGCCQSSVHDFKMIFSRSDLALSRL